jgi:hypothetical protein
LAVCAELLAVVGHGPKRGYVLLTYKSTDGAWSLVLSSDKVLLRSCTPAGGWYLNLVSTRRSVSYAVRLVSDPEGVAVVITGIQDPVRKATMTQSLQEALARNPEVLRVLELQRARLERQAARVHLGTSALSYRTGPYISSTFPVASMPEEVQRVRLSVHEYLAEQEILIWRHRDVAVRRLAWQWWLYNREQGVESIIDAKDLLHAAASVLE